MSGKGRGGKREGAGRHPVEEKRKQRAIHFFDGEWELIQRKARERGMNTREYIYYLAERDKPNSKKQLENN